MYHKLIKVICIIIFLGLLYGCSKQEDNIYFQPFDATINSENSKNRLIELGIITEYDIDKDENITVMEGLQILYRIANCSTPLSFWYQLPETEHLDYVDEWNKYILTSMWGEDVIITEEFLSINLDKYLTEYEALVFITRLLGNTYGCVQMKDERFFTTKEQTYEVAFQKALISNTSLTNLNKLISRDEYFILVHRALYAKLMRGGIAGTHDFKYIDLFSGNNKYDISSEVIRNGDTSDNSNADDEKIAYLILILKDEYKEIGVNNTSVIIQGKEILPGIYTHFQREWVSEIITLANEEVFKKDTYYLLTSYQCLYRKAEYNSIAFYLFKSDQTSNVLNSISEAGNILFHVNISGQPSKGVVYTDEIHIQEVCIEGDAINGYTIYLTPESSNIFEVVEGSEHKY